MNGNPSPNGQFVPGNPGGPGNPHAGQVAKLRAVMLTAVTEDDMRAVTQKLVELAKDGDLKAIDLLLNRTLGKADSGPLVAVQMNQPANGSGEGPSKYGHLFASVRESRHDPGRIAAIVERVRAERAEREATGVEDVPVNAEELARSKA